MHTLVLIVRRSGQWIPLDEHEGRSGTSMSAGHLMAHGRMNIDERIEWMSAGADPDLSDAAAQDSPEETDNAPALIAFPFVP